MQDQDINQIKLGGSEMQKPQAKFDKSFIIKHKEEDLKFECQICITQI